MRLLTFLGILFFTHANAQTTFNWVIDEQLFHQIKIAREFKTKIEEKLKNKITINLVLVSADSGKEEMRSGKYQISQMIAGNFSKYVPEFKIWEMPFLFSSKTQLEKYLESEKAQANLKRIESDAILPVGYSYAGGFLNFYSSEKMNSFAELAGKKCYSAPEFGFKEDFLEPLEVYGEHDLDSKKFECGEILSSEVDSIYSMPNPQNLWVNITNHRVVTRVTLISKKALSAFSEKEQKLIVTELRHHLKKERNDVYEAAEISLKLIRNKGAHVHVWDKTMIESQKKIFLKNLNQYKNSLKEEVDYILNLEKNSDPTPVISEI